MTTVSLIPRAILFGNPDKTSVQISPDGRHIAYLASLDGVLNIWIAPCEDLGAAWPVTHDTGRGIHLYRWAYTNRHLLYLQDKDGDDNGRLYSVDLANGAVKNLTPFEGVQTRLKHASPRCPEEVVVGLNHRNPQWHDLYRINLVTGTLTLLEPNDHFMDFLVDDDYNVPGAFCMTQEGGLDFFRRTRAGDWALWDTADNFMTTYPVAAAPNNAANSWLDKTGTEVLMIDSRDRNTSAVAVWKLDTHETSVLAEDPWADAHDVICHPTERYVQAVSFIHERKCWQILDPSLEPDLAYLQRVADGEIDIISQTLDDQFWIVRYLMDDGPARFYLYDRQCRTARFLFTDRQDLEGQPLVKMRLVVIRSRDGLDLVAYYSLPSGSDSNGDGVPGQPLPLVFTPHGGPWGRDTWGYNAWHQWLANRGYAVLCVNFRASRGFGKTFLNAGNRCWDKVIDDQVDAVQWAMANGIADPQRVAVMGASFGGYSALAGLTFTPELYACGVDLFGMSDLLASSESTPPPMKPMTTTYVGDDRTAEGRALLKRLSPLTYVDRICRPLLIGQGANDPRVKRAQSDQIVAALQARRIPVTYVLYPDEGHFFIRPENNRSFNAITEAFLSKYLGGRCEPIGDDFQGSSLQILTGADEIPGLSEAFTVQID
ncbi:MAG: prolyl oligopeptidase family serine peptidase [Chloroflexi bacterium]|nr:prolyl oligopeptidase family serine peptidase [Chloroflexota bacterium]